MSNATLNQKLANTSNSKFFQFARTKVPFQDHVAVFGSFAIFAEIVYVHWAVPPLTLQLTVMTVGLAMLFIVGRRSISEMISVGRQIVLGQSA